MISIFNPFTKIAGGRALFFGIIIAISTLTVSFYSQAIFDGVLDFHVTAFNTIWPYVSVYLISWVCLVVYFALAGTAFTHTKFRWLDLLGMTLLSRFPLLIVSVVAFAIPYIDKEQLQDITSIHFTAGFFIASTLSLLCLIWSVALYYNCYRISLNIKGAKAVWSFILVLLLAEITSLAVIHLIVFK